MSTEMTVGDNVTIGELFASKEEIADAVRDILRNETEPMHINYLYKLVTDRGLRINGKNPKGNLSAKLAPLSDVVYLRDKGWLLRENLHRNMRRRLNELSGSTNGNGSELDSLPSPDSSNPAR